MNQLIHKIGITFIPKVGVVTARNLISYCGNVEAVFRTSRKALLKIPGVGPEIAQSIISQNVLIRAEKEIEYLNKQNITPLFYLDNDYPKRLRHLFDAPILLYYKGNADLNSNRTVAIIGTRKPSHRGISICQEFVHQLKDLEVLLVSGLAYGIDITAHKACLQHNILNVGVVGHGLDTIYPSDHSTTAAKMIHHGGILSEFPSGTLPDGRHFPMRNRIIAGLADALIIVENSH